MLQEEKILSLERRPVSRRCLAHSKTNKKSQMLCLLVEMPGGENPFLREKTRFQKVLGAQ